MCIDTGAQTPATANEGKMCSAGTSDGTSNQNSAVDAAVQTHTTQEVIMLRNRNQQLELKLKAKEKLARRAVVGQRAALKMSFELSQRLRQSAGTVQHDELDLPSPTVDADAILLITTVAGLWWWQEQETLAQNQHDLTLARARILMPFCWLLSIIAANCNETHCLSAPMTSHVQRQRYDACTSALARCEKKLALLRQRSETRCTTF